MRLVYRYITVCIAILLIIIIIIKWSRSGGEEDAAYELLKKWGPDAVFYRPVSVIGEGVGSLCLLGSSQTEKRHNKFRLKKKYNVNVCSSDVVPLNRPVPDSRPKGCKDLHYSTENLPSATVIIPFHNEWPSLLFRTVYSIIHRSPKQLLKEIVLVDDNSDYEISNEISEYVKAHYKNSVVKLFQEEDRQGLIRCRLKGIKYATGDVIVFLDSHVEVNEQWLEPLLEEIRKDEKTVPVGNLDYINTETLKYEHAPGYRLRYGFDWRLRVFGTYFTKEQMEGKKETDSLPGVVLIGSGFAISHKYFKSIGTYDDSMKIWGGENLELSWRIWLCGGRIVHVPCSQVGHIERDQPYVFPDGRKKIELYNNKRAIDVWMGDYKQYVYNVYPQMQGSDAGNIDARLSLKNRLQCKPFDWFLDNIWPELFPYNRNVQQSGSIGLRKIQTPMCLDNDFYVLSEPRYLIARHCSISDYQDSQMFALTNKQELRTTLHCVTVKNEDRDYVPWLQGCFEINDKWTLTEEGLLKHESSGLCLELLQNGLVMSNCNSKNLYQLWSFQPAY